MAVPFFFPDSPILLFRLIKPRLFFLRAFDRYAFIWE